MLDFHGNPVHGAPGESTILRKILNEAARISKLYAWHSDYVLGSFVLDLYFPNLQLAIVGKESPVKDVPGIVLIRANEAQIKDHTHQMLRYAIAFAYCTGRSPDAVEYGKLDRMQVMPTYEQKRAMDKWIMSYAKAKAKNNTMRKTK